MVTNKVREAGGHPFLAHPSAVPDEPSHLERFLWNLDLVAPPRGAAGLQLTPISETFIWLLVTGLESLTNMAADACLDQNLVAMLVTQLMHVMSSLSKKTHASVLPLSWSKKCCRAPLCDLDG